MTLNTDRSIRLAIGKEPVASDEYDDDRDSVAVTPERLKTNSLDPDLGFALHFYYLLPESGRVRFWEIIADENVEKRRVSHNRVPAAPPCEPLTKPAERPRRSRGKTVSVTHHVQRAAEEADARIKALLASRNDRKQFGNPGGVRDVMRAEIITQAIRLAIAEEVLSGTSLYGDTIRAEYVRRCDELGLRTEDTEQ